MAISSSEAAEALRDISEADQRTRISGAYSAGSPHLILWGAIWVVGYVGTGLTQPDLWNWLWLPLILIGAIGSGLFGARARQSTDAAASRSKQPGIVNPLLMAATIMIFFICVYTVFGPASPRAYIVFPALLTGLVYMVVGMLVLPRYAWIGAGIWAVSMAGYAYGGSQLPFWIAVAGGGGLILGGLWLRKV